MLIITHLKEYQNNCLLCPLSVYPKAVFRLVQLYLIIFCFQGFGGLEDADHLRIENSGGNHDLVQADVTVVFSVRHSEVDYNLYRVNASLDGLPCSLPMPFPTQTDMSDSEVRSVSKLIMFIRPLKFR